MLVFGWTINETYGSSCANMVGFGVSEISSTLPHRKQCKINKLLERRHSSLCALRHNTLLNSHSSLCAARQSDKESPLCEAQNKMKMPNLTHFVRSGHDKNSNLSSLRGRKDEDQRSSAFYKKECCAKMRCLIDLIRRTDQGMTIGKEVCDV